MEKISKEIFHFLKYNNIEENIVLSENDNNYYNEFINKMNLLEKALKNKDNSLASNTLGSIMNMFGFNRHYCSISGQPIIGKYFKINGKPVSKDAYDSYKLIQQMERLGKMNDLKKENKINEKKHG
jgi:hypothetical protein